MKVTNDYLIKKAASVISPKIIGDSLFGTVGCALVSDKGKVYTGVCIVVWSGMGFCAEHAAIASMITNKEYKIKKIVAVWKSLDNKVYVVPPCGRCREFMHRVNPENLNVDIILSKNKTKKLKELLPMCDWEKDFKIPFKKRI